MNSKFAKAAEMGVDAKGRATGYILMGLPLQAIIRRMTEEGWPRELVPSDETLATWRRELQPEQVRRTEEGWSALAQRAIVNAHKIMDDIEAGTVQLRPVEAFVIAGIAADKVARFEDAASRRHGANALGGLHELVLRKEAERKALELPPPIDAEAREL